MVAADLVCGRIEDAATVEFISMATSFSDMQLERLRREAKRLRRESPVSHSEALDRIAVRHGFKNWSILVKHREPLGARAAPHTTPEQNPRGGGSKRHYLHGDVHADDPTRCYCSRCDLFVELTHFEGLGHHGDGEDGTRYLRSLALHNELPPEQKAARSRPNNAPNILALRAVRERDEREASRSPFHLWLEGQRKRNDNVGDLATDILGDKSFPVALTNRRELEEYLSRHGSHIVKAIRDAWREFSASKFTG